MSAAPVPTPRPVLEVQGLTVRFGPVTAVDDVTFDLLPGQVLGLIGPNGAGKTTIFDGICGYVAASGTVKLDGQLISDTTPDKRARARLGRSFQDAKLFPSLTVTEAIAMAFERHVRAWDPISTGFTLPWVRKAERKVQAEVDRLVELMGLTAFRDKFVSELSTGSRRIVDLACTLAHQPLVLLLDEPSSGIAQREAEALGPLILRIRQELGASVLLIEHDMPLLTSVSDEVLALEQGAVVVQGHADEVLHDPRIIAAYLGTTKAVVERSGPTASSTQAVEVVEEAPAPTPRAPRKAAARKAPAAKKAAPAKQATATKAAPAKKAAAAKAAPAKRAAATRATAATKKAAATTKQAAAGTTKKAAATTKKAAAAKTAT